MPLSALAIHGTTRLSQNHLTWLLEIMPDLICKINKFKIQDDISRTVVGHALARFMISKTQHVPFQSFTIVTNKYGKPSFKECNIEFNVSHSSEYVVCAIDSVPIGIDIEKIIPVQPSIISMFTSSEKDYILSQDDFLSAFFRIWTLKESYIKAIGTGLSTPLNHFSVIKNGDVIPTIVNSFLPKLSFSEFNIAPNYICSLCSRDALRSKQIEQISIEDFITHLQCHHKAITMI